MYQVDSLTHCLHVEFLSIVENYSIIFQVIDRTGVMSKLENAQPDSPDYLGR